MLVAAAVTADTDTVDVCASGNAYAVANITADAIDPDLPENTLYLEGYTVTYAALTEGAPPIEAASYQVSQALPVGDLSVVVVDQGRKEQFLHDVTLGGYGPDEDFPAYSAEFTFSGEDSYGSEFEATASLTFRVGQYTACTPSVSPSSIRLTGASNPDTDLSDDITFHISGGIAPYTVYSDDEGVIEAPGLLGTGVESFTVDPAAVASETAVAVTVVDSGGNSAVAAVTVTPATGTLAISPSAISLTSLENPDLDGSDDVTFYISGGTAPYTVYSDNEEVIDAPGALGEGVASFTVDPDEAPTETTVALTAVDSLGSTATAAVTLTPAY
jgi:hypothetical protein